MVNIIILLSINVNNVVWRQLFRLNKIKLWYEHTNGPVWLIKILQFTTIIIEQAQAKYIKVWKLY